VIHYLERVKIQALHRAFLSTRDPGASRVLTTSRICEYHDVIERSSLPDVDHRPVHDPSALDLDKFPGPKLRHQFRKNFLGGNLAAFGRVPGVIGAFPSPGRIGTANHGRPSSAHVHAARGPCRRSIGRPDKVPASDVVRNHQAPRPIAAGPAGHLSGQAPPSLGEDVDACGPLPRVCACRAGLFETAEAAAKNTISSRAR
jgi:hypothetical protein